jgi:inner membrane protein
MALIMIWGSQLIDAITVLDNHYLMMAILIALLSFLFLNKKLLMVFLPMFFISLFLIPAVDITYLEIVFSLFLGLFSHVVLDSFTPAGIKIFAPVSSRKVYRNFGLSMIFLLIFVAILYNIPLLFELFGNYVVGG